MKEYESFCNSQESKSHNKSLESIIAFKISDQCRLKECFTLGPVISAEDCTCIIVPADNEEHLGRVILPHRPICLPELVASIKIIGDSFKIKKIEVCDISPSGLRAGCWDVDVVFTFEFKIQLYDIYMNKLSVICCYDNCRFNENKNSKSFILGLLKYEKTVTLFSPLEDAPNVACDILFENSQPSLSSPHALVEAKSYHIDSDLRTPDDACEYEEMLDGIYDEPITYIYVTIGLFMVIKLFGISSILTESKGYEIPKLCEEEGCNSCRLFKEVEFPYNEFMPESKKSD